MNIKYLKKLLELENSCPMYDKEINIKKLILIPDPLNVLNKEDDDEEIKDEEKTEFLNRAAQEGWWLWFYHDPKTVAVKIINGEKYFDVTDEVKRSPHH